MIGYKNIGTRRRSSVSDYLKGSGETRKRIERVNENNRQQNFDRYIGFFTGKTTTLDSVKRATMLDREQFELLSTIVSQTPSTKVSQMLAERTRGTNEYGNNKYFDENIQSRKVAECANNLANMFTSDNGFKRYVFTMDKNNCPLLCYLTNKVNENSSEELSVETIRGLSSYRAAGEEVPEGFEETASQIDAFANLVLSNSLVDSVDGPTA